MNNIDDIKNVNEALTAINKLCSSCTVCAPECPVATAKRAMEALRYDLQKMYTDTK